jgi:serine protease Do
MRVFVAALLALVSASSAATEEPSAYCSGDYADDLAQLAAQARELEQQSYSFCVRNTATYECLSYDDGGEVRRTRRKATLHGTAFGYRHMGGDTLLMTNEHVAEWPPVTSRQHPVDGIPLGCKRVSEAIRIVDNEADSYETDDISLSRVVADPQLDAAVLRAHVALPILPWKVGRSGALRERNVVEVRGFPLGAFAATNVGKVISAHDHDDYKEWDHDDFVVDALLSSGNSGSPVLAVSCLTGEFELVGVYHAGYSEGSALNVVIAIDQLRDLMTTLKRTPRPHAEPPVALDEPARATLAQGLAAEPTPFFPFGPFTATIRLRADGALLFELFSREFPFKTYPILVFEDLAKTGAFGELGRTWLGSARGLRTIAPADLDADGQAQLTRVADAVVRDAIAFFSWRGGTAATASRDQFEHFARQERSLGRTVESRRDLAQTMSDLADRFAPHGSDPVVALAEAFTPPIRAVAQQLAAPPGQTDVGMKVAPHEPNASP